MTAAGLSRRAALSGGIAGLLAAAAAPAYARRDVDADVIVVGAGIAGLETALRLIAAGCSVHVVEAGIRLGGRLRTASSLPGTPNLGGVQIGPGYRRLRARAAAVGLELAPEPTAPRASRMFLGSRAIESAAWRTDPDNPFPERFKALTPASALFALAAAEGANPLAGLDDWRGPAGTGADISAAQFLERAGFGAQARRLVDAGLNGNDLASYSMLNIWRTQRLYEQERALGGSLVVPGGSQRLPEAMARGLQRPVHLRFPVAAIAADASGVTVTSRQGTSYRGQVCVAALPFPALRRISLSAPLGDATREAIASLPYTQILQVIIEPQVRFWDSDGLPADLWSDGPLERIIAIRDSAGLPTGQLLVWLNGTGTLALDRMAFDWDLDPATSALAQTIGQELARLRPASEGRVQVRAVQRWTASNPVAGGAYMHWAPGQVARWAGRMGAPAGRLLFAGEHLGLVHTGMEAAFESAERAADDALALLRAR
jgi:monoamine oxidase